MENIFKFKIEQRWVENCAFSTDKSP